MRWVAVHAGRSVARWTLHPITLYFLLMNHTARRASNQYLARALGRPVGWADVYRHIHCFAATVLDRVYFLQERCNQFEIHSTGADLIHSAMDRHDGVMLMGAHLGSFEALRSVAQMRGGQVAMLMYEDNARQINASLAAVAPTAQLHTIALGRPGAMLALKNWLDAGNFAGLLADRRLASSATKTSKRAATVELAFLGQPAHFSDGPFRLSAMLRRQVIFMAGLYMGGNRYELRFSELADFRNLAPGTDLDAQVRDALQRYVTLLEALCVEAPCNWFNFFDFWAQDASQVTK
jgi:predicted LPLAT superfamily acyltransferase